MAKVLVVADDLTGANASAAGFARTSMRAVTPGRADEWSAITQFHPQFDAIVVTTDSRHADPHDVRGPIHDAVRAGWPVELLSTRIDTTLRGNIGIATEAMLTTVRELSDRRVMALCPAAHPEAGRVTVDGHQLLGGQRLELTELARDPRTPVDTSDVGEVLTRFTDLRIGYLPLRSVTSPHDELVDTIRELLHEDIDVIVADALTVDHPGAGGRSRSRRGGRHPVDDRRPRPRCVGHGHRARPPRPVQRQTTAGSLRVGHRADPGPAATTHQRARLPHRQPDASPRLGGPRCRRDRPRGGARTPAGRPRRDRPRRHGPRQQPPASAHLRGGRRAAGGTRRHHSADSRAGPGGRPLHHRW
ncbi:four-carbon acid sugar kinase family protein [Janibacter limosus]|uniref:Four-carbon acid sugar kinase family protein n=1 Tax=Janibacter limosus TaxID=53458 RepID=A0AC61U7H1_9MICO|nr:four-carbon acid sugar kinase family protein [Janibacter limosus]UUZ45984.1 four-carbon acid sugar kinase family protein [Janibacter limosus]